MCGAHLRSFILIKEAKFECAKSRGGSDGAKNRFRQSQGVAHVCAETIRTASPHCGGLDPAVPRAARLHRLV